MQVCIQKKSRTNTAVFFSEIKTIFLSSRDKCIFRFYAEIQDGPNNGGMSLEKQVDAFAHTLQTKISVEIALSCKISKKNALIYLNKNSRWSRKNDRIMNFWKKKTKKQADDFAHTLLTKASAQTVSSCSIFKINVFPFYK